MESSPGAAGNRLDVDDWIQAGYAIFAEDGLQALKIDRLCDRLGVTTRPPTAGRWCPPWHRWRRCPPSAAPSALALGMKIPRTAMV